MARASIHRFSITALSFASAAVLLTACGGGSGAGDTAATAATAASASALPTTAQATTSVADTGSAASSKTTSNTSTSTSGVVTAAPAPNTATSTPPPTTAAAGPFGQDASQYALSFSEEFDGFDASKWNDHIWYQGSNSTKNYAVEDGKLKIWPQRDASGNFFDRTIDTDGKYYQTYGYFEMEAKLPPENTLSSRQQSLAGPVDMLT